MGLLVGQARFDREFGQGDGGGGEPARCGVGVGEHGLDFIARKARNQDDAASFPEVFEIKVEYLAAPSLDDKILILADPMLATGSSLIAVHETLKNMGNVKQVHLIAVIASEEGIENVARNFPADTHLWVATVDPRLNEQGYIVPGLGDAGDLSFGAKL